jgi:hypothetical protein
MSCFCDLSIFALEQLYLRCSLRFLTDEEFDFAQDINIVFKKQTIRLKARGRLTAYST